MSDLRKNKIPKIKLVYNPKVKPSERPKVSSASDAHDFFRENWDDMTINLYEEFKILLLNRSNKVLGIVDMAKGGMTGTLVDVRLVFTSALKAGACSIILGHNHPSGNLKPSEADKNLTDKLIKGGKVLDISILDHIILSADDYYSFNQNGLMPL